MQLSHSSSSQSLKHSKSPSQSYSPPNSFTFVQIPDSKPKLLNHGHNSNPSDDEEDENNDEEEDENEENEEDEEDEEDEDGYSSEILDRLMEVKKVIQQRIEDIEKKISKGKGKNKMKSYVQQTFDNAIQVASSLLELTTDGSAPFSSVKKHFRENIQKIGLEDITLVLNII